MLVDIFALSMQAPAASVNAGAAEALKPFKCPTWSGTLYYPELAAWKRIEGEAVVNCAVSAKGRLSDCHTVAETPPGWGFGDAAVITAQCLLKGEPQSAGRADVPITFTLPVEGEAPLR